jgi:hypothetical protein
MLCHTQYLLVLPDKELGGVELWTVLKMLDAATVVSPSPVQAELTAKSSLHN